MAFAKNSVEMRDIETGEIIHEMEVGTDDEVSDMDFYKDESNIILSLRSSNYVKINLLTGEINLHEHNQAS
jgi:hypothetical protein